ncbi:MAG: hypothetical protein ABII71_06020 [Candidatus Micrarchaeota archaeon]
MGLGEQSRRLIFCAHGGAQDGRPGGLRDFRTDARSGLADLVRKMDPAARLDLFKVRAKNGELQQPKLEALVVKAMAFKEGAWNRFEEGTLDGSNLAAELCRANVVTELASGISTTWRRAKDKGDKAAEMGVQASEAEMCLALEVMGECNTAAGVLLQNERQAKLHEVSYSDDEHEAEGTRNSYLAPARELYDHVHGLLCEHAARVNVEIPQFEAVVQQSQAEVTVGRQQPS